MQVWLNEGNDGICNFGRLVIISINHNLGHISDTVLLSLPLNNRSQWNGGVISGMVPD